MKDVSKNTYISNKVQLSEGQNSCDIPLIPQLSRANLSLWIRPFNLFTAPFFGPMI